MDTLRTRDTALELKKIIIIVPTYNERENIGRLIDALQDQFTIISHDMHILVVDDNSPDETADIVRKRQIIYPNIHLLMGPKKGLGAAYIRGIHYALNDLKADAVFEMDSDFSHKPEDVPRLIKSLNEGADFVIGSRYIDGGSVPKNWGLMRRMNSRFGNIVARHIAGLHKVHDCTAGFRAIRASFLRKINLENLRVQGYAFQVALLHEALSFEANIKEIPVDFIDRSQGESKLGLSDIVEFIINAWWIRFRSLRTFIKFALVGISGVIVNLGMFAFLLYFGMNKYLASPIAIEVSIITNFFFNNYWTFRWRKSRDRIRIKGLKFNIVSLLSLSVSYSTFLVLSFMLPNFPPYIHQLLGIIPGMLINYFMNSYWTFKHAPEPI